MKFTMAMSMPIRVIVLILSFCLLLGLAGTGVYGISKWLCSTPFFTVTGVTIKGCNRVREDSILELSGVKPDSNLLALDMKAIAAAIEKHPWIASASISKKLPDRLEIVVQEREPVAMVSYEGLYLVDMHGKIFKKIATGEHFDLPVITGLESLFSHKKHKAQMNKETTPDDSADPARLQLRKALDIIKLASTGTRTLGVNDISEIHVNGDNLVLYTSDKGLMLKFNEETPLSLQFRRAEKILYHLYSSGKYRKIAMVELDYGSNTALAKTKN